MKYFIVISLSLIVFSCTNPADTILDPASLPNCTDQEMNTFEIASNTSQGLIVTDPLDGFITLAVAKESHGGPWSPINGRKKMVYGFLKETFVEDGLGDEYDWNLDIIPQAGYADVIQNAKAVSDSNCEWQKYFLIGADTVHLQCPQLFNNTVSGYFVSGNFYKESDLKKFRNLEFFQAEVTPDQTLYKNDWFPEAGSDEKSIVVGKTIGVYGPWVLDVGHGARPEIHPCEVIWWKDSAPNIDTFTIMGIQDDANRFDKSSDFTGTSVPTTNAWAQPPIKSIYKIPFEYDGRHFDHLIIQISELKAHNVVTASIDGFGDSDDGNNHVLKLKTKFENSATGPSNILAEVNETQPVGANVGVSFVDICKKPNGNIIGYVQLKTAYGKSDGQEGYQVLRVIVNHPFHTLPNEENHIR